MIALLPIRGGTKLSSEQVGKTARNGTADEAFMAMELSAGTLAGRGGLVRYLPEFDRMQRSDLRPLYGVRL